MPLARYVLFHSETESSYTFIEDTAAHRSNALPADAVQVWQVEAESWEIACLKRNDYLGWETYKPMIVDDNDLRELVPRHKHDHDRVRLLLNLGYPVIAPALPELFGWIQDMNWPIAATLAPFLASLGHIVEPQVRQILASPDGMWKYWVLTAVVAEMPMLERLALQPALKEFLLKLTEDDRLNEADVAAREILARLS